MVCFLWRTAAFCLLLLYRNKMQHRAFRLYLFAAAALLRRCFSASAPKTVDAFSSSKKDTASIAVRKQPSLYMYVTHPYRRNWLWVEKRFIYHHIRFFNAVYKKYINPTMKLTNMNIVLSRRCCDTYQ